MLQLRRLVLVTSQHQAGCLVTQPKRVKADGTRVWQATMGMENQVSKQASMNLTARHDPAAALLPDASRRTEEFLAMLGHEMRNPLSALSNALDVWESEGADPVQMEELRHVMKRQVAHLIRLSDDLLDTERIAQGKLKLRQERVELRPLIDSACEETRPFLDQCGHSLIVTISTEAIAVRGDPSRLLQVFTNLIENAAKFSGRHGSLCVTVARQEAMAVVSICDNGEGIEEDKLHTLFETFTQGNEAPTTAYNGLGIGLRLVKSIVTLHGGDVSVKSDGPGCGSEFTVRLPLLNNSVHHKQPAGKKPSVRSAGSGQRPTGRRILVVDDERSLAEMLGGLLRSYGHTVSVADDAATAIQKVLEERPQVVILDIKLRGMDGCEVARQLRGYAELAGLVLIALSGISDEHTRQRARAAGFDAYLVKATSITELIETVAGCGQQTRK